jgi:hypothetical protein
MVLLDSHNAVPVVWRRLAQNLSTASQSDPTNIVFQSQLSDGAHIAVSDSTGCEVFWQDPAYPASNPDTTSITVTLTPVGTMIDGTSTTVRRHLPAGATL